MSQHSDQPEKIEKDSRVRGEAGVFFVDRAASGTVFGFVKNKTIVGVKLDDGEIAWVPTTTVHLA
jgi:hypothetical protein